MPFFCSICGEESTRICARCTKDTCSNHLCEKCFRCSDCCECEVILDEPHREAARSAFRTVAQAQAGGPDVLPVPPAQPSPDVLPMHPQEPGPDVIPPPNEPEPHEPPPDPDPFPGPEPEPGIP